MNAWDIGLVWTLYFCYLITKMKLICDISGCKKRLIEQKIPTRTCSACVPMPASFLPTEPPSNRWCWYALTLLQVCQCTVQREFKGKGCTIKCLWLSFHIKSESLITWKLCSCWLWCSLLRLGTMHFIINVAEKYGITICPVKSSLSNLGQYSVNMIWCLITLQAKTSPQFKGLDHIVCSVVRFFKVTLLNWEKLIQLGNV